MSRFAVLAFVYIHAAAAMAAPQSMPFEDRDLGALFLAEAKFPIPTDACVNHSEYFSAPSSPMLAVCQIPASVLPVQKINESQAANPVWTDLRHQASEPAQITIEGISCEVREVTGSAGSDEQLTHMPARGPVFAIYCPEKRFSEDQAAEAFKRYIALQKALTYTFLTLDSSIPSVVPVRRRQVQVKIDVNECAKTLRNNPAMGSLQCGNLDENVFPVNLNKREDFNFPFTRVHFWSRMTQGNDSRFKATYRTTVRYARSELPPFRTVYSVASAQISGIKHDDREILEKEIWDTLKAMPTAKLDILTVNDGAPVHAFDRAFRVSSDACKASLETFDYVPNQTFCRIKAPTTQPSLITGKGSRFEDSDPEHLAFERPTGAWTEGDDTYVLSIFYTFLWDALDFPKLSRPDEEALIEKLAKAHPLLTTRFAN